MAGETLPQRSPGALLLWPGCAQGGLDPVRADTLAGAGGVDRSVGAGGGGRAHSRVALRHRLPAELGGSDADSGGLAYPRAYCRVPNGSTVDMIERIEAQIERSAPEVRGCILGRHTFSAPQMRGHNPNYVGGDINVGQDLRQLYFRPVASLAPYATPVPGFLLCSS